MGPENPIAPMHVVRTIKRFYKGRAVKVILIPDIESVNYGRDVGYEVNYHVPPQAIAEISGSRLRELAEQFQMLKLENEELRRELDERA
jgi:hypothetical protein